MAAITIDDLVTGAQSLSDKVNDPSVDTPTWYRYVNASIEELWRLITAENPTYFDAFGDQTIISAANPFIDLVASPFTVDATSGGWTVRKIRLVEKDPTSSVPVTIVKRTFQTKDQQRYPRGYILSGKRIYMDPPTVAPGNYRVYYTAGPTILGAAGAIPAELIPYREYFELAASIRALGSEETDIGDEMQRLTEMRQAIMVTVANQDSATPDRIQDTLANDELQRWGLIYPGGWF
jgi:hypothetical protein